jgi:hypothetical protein
MVFVTGKADWTGCTKSKQDPGPSSLSAVVAAVTLRLLRVREGHQELRA